MRNSDCAAAGLGTFVGRLAAYGEAATATEMDALIARAWGLERAATLGRLLPA